MQAARLAAVCDVARPVHTDGGHRVEVDLALDGHPWDHKVPSPYLQYARARGAERIVGTLRHQTRRQAASWACDPRCAHDETNA
jgi:hypothetical protein